MSEPRPATVTRSAPESRGAKRLVLVTAVLALIGFAYGAGRLQAAGYIKAANRFAEAASASASARIAELGKTEQRVLMLEARRRLALAEAALDQRNFGTAEEHLHAAGALAARGSGSPADSELAAALSRARLTASEDVGAERRNVVGWAARLDELVPMMKP